MKSEYSQQDNEKKSISDQLSRLTATAKEHIVDLERIELRLEEVEELTKRSNNTNENPLIKFRASITSLKVFQDKFRNKSRQ